VATKVALGSIPPLLQAGLRSGLSVLLLLAWSHCARGAPVRARRLAGRGRAGRA
jgi:hypothetical protein